MANKRDKELENENLKDAREKRNDLISIIIRGILNGILIAGIVFVIYILSSSPDCLRDFFKLLKDIFSNNKTYWAAIGGLSILNYALYKLYLQKNDTVAKLDEVLQNSLPQNNKALLIQIEELLKKYKNK